MKKKWVTLLRIPAFVLFLAGVGLLMYYGHQQRDQADCRNIDIRFSEAPQLTTSAEIYRLVRQRCDTLEGFLRISLPALESALDTLPFIRKAEVFRTLNGTLVTTITERTPVARVFFSEGPSFYIDENLALIPVREGFHIDVPVVTGHLPRDASKAQRFLNADSLKNITYLDEAAGFLAYIRLDAFWQAQVEQVYITSEGELELVPRVGNHVVLLGDTSHTAGKLAKLRMFYQEGLSRGGWNDFQYINLKFKNQVICKKTPHNGTQ